MNKINNRLLLALGVGSVFLLYGLSRNSNKLSAIKPLNEIAKESESFDINPRDSILSVIEGEEFIRGTGDKDKNSSISSKEADDLIKTINSFLQDNHTNTEETGKNLQRALDFILIRQSINSSSGEMVAPKQLREKELSYSDFLKVALQEEKPLVKKVILTNNSDSIQAVFLDGSVNKVRIPSDVTALKELADTLANKSIQVEVKAAQNNTIGSLLLLFSPMILILLLFILMARGQKGLFSQLSSFKRNIASGKSEVTFNDVAGMDENKAELEEIVEFLKNPEKYQALGARVPKGVLLVGPPGTGKTLLAKAVAGEAGVPFFNLSGSDFVEMFVGLGASRTRNLFSDAKKSAPCVVFIDEIDAVGRSRGAGLGGGHDEREQTLNQLLVEMDGFSTGSGIVVLAATNRPDILDTALLRAGRFDRQIVIDRPDINGREAILKVHARNKPLNSNVNLRILAQRTPGFTGADLANILNEAALLAGRKGKNAVSMEDLEEAIDKAIAGVEKKSRVITPENKELTAYHEIGHALVAFYEKNSDPLHKVTIIPRGMALGLTMTRPEEDHLNFTKSQLLARIKLLLGGRVAEEIVFHEISTGAENDLQRATELVRDMVTRFGMSEKLGPLTYGKSNEQVFLGRDFGNTKNYSEETAREIDLEMRRVIDGLCKEVRELLTNKRKEMDVLVEVLLEKETLERDEFAEIVSRVTTKESI